MRSVISVKHFSQQNVNNNYYLFKKKCHLIKFNDIKKFSFFLVIIKE